jgi:conjugative transfer region protein (TIGR03750 family)
MILTHINHKMPIYKDCTLAECLIVSSAILIIGETTLGMLTRLLFGYGSIGSAIVLLSFVHLSRFFLARLQRLKYGKPYGYYSQLFLKRLSQWSPVQIFWQSPYIVRQGRWSVSRRHTYA